MSELDGVVPPGTPMQEETDVINNFTPKISPDASTATKSVQKQDEEGVETPRTTDVLCGRGGNINTHPGNETFRSMVSMKKKTYLTARFKREKRIIAESIVNGIGKLDPPGRFLSRNPATGLWHDIGFEKARDKTSQALRENAPSIRKEIEKENKAKREEMEREEEAARAAYYYHRYPSYHPESYQARDDYDGYYRREHRYDLPIPRRSMSYDDDYDDKYRHSVRRTVSYDHEGDRRYYSRGREEREERNRVVEDSRFSQAMDLEPIAEWRDVDIDFQDPKEKNRFDQHHSDYSSSRDRGHLQEYSPRDSESYHMQRSHNPENSHLKRHNEYADYKFSSPTSSTSSGSILHYLPSRRYEEKRDDFKTLSPTFSRPQKLRVCSESPKERRDDMKRSKSLWSQLSQSFLDNEDSFLPPLCGTTADVHFGTQDNNEMIEEEGQEVELFKSLEDSMDCEGDVQMTPNSDGRGDEKGDQLPVPASNDNQAYGCHLFISETLQLGNGFGASLFPSNSMEMDILSIGSGGKTDQQSSVGSLGGSSLCKVFDNDNSLLDVTSPKSKSEKSITSDGTAMSLHYSQESFHDSGDLLKKLGVDI